ncbi:MAG: NFACT family protein [Acidilobus sp.]|nr:NFACT family protein [Acidilobus sp.]
MARKSMSALDVFAWVSAARSYLVGERVDNIYQEGNLLALRVRGRYGDHLIAEPSVRVHMSSRFRPQGPPEGGLGRALRDTVRGQRITDVKQVGFDRVVEVVFEGGHRLVVELLPRGVAALVTPNGLLQASTSYLEAKDRVLRRGQQYLYPPLRLDDPFSLPPDRLLSNIVSSRASDLVRSLVLSLGIPGEAAEEAIRRAQLSPTMKPQDLTVQQAELLSQSLRSIKEEASAGRGYLVIAGGRPVEADPFRPTVPGAKVKEFETLDEALDELFSASAREASAPSRLEAERQRLLRSLEAAKRESLEYARRAEELEAQANALASHYEAAQSAIECVRRRAGECGPIVKSFNRSSGDLVLDLEGVEVRVKVYEDVDEAIKRLYREAGELRAKSQRAASAEAEVKERLARLEEELRLQELRERARRRKREWYERYHWLVTSSGFLAIGGRDADQNESIVRKYLRDDDIFLHADVHGAPAVVVFASGCGVPESDIEEAAVLTAAYSRAWKEGMGYVNVYWAMGSQVSKSPPAGEYLTKGAFMVYGKKNYVQPVRLELYLGVALDEEGLPVVVVGPKSVVAPQSLSYVRLVPGDEKVEELALEALEAMAKQAPSPDLVRSLDPSEVAARLPGRGRIAGAWRGEGRGVRRPSAPPCRTSSAG